MVIFQSDNQLQEVEEAQTFYIRYTALSMPLVVLTQNVQKLPYLAKKRNYSNIIPAIQFVEQYKVEKLDTVISARTPLLDELHLGPYVGKPFSHHPRSELHTACTTPQLGNRGYPVHP